ncbi:MAG: glycerophosphoryl diester phosphodiesterase membrane domain-containing protein [Ruminococcus sp.]|uniref:glycerophosphodiester phosphodiesterase family protein n=1 Tax=uncultured Ruminococcus sp. TaxID=165186 RepID=UPI001564A761|nr:glycerophosphodiester phosphodiesterase family protein [uncultured Ruminococcus sp.]MCR4862504.1 glycerophosphoryl diester phosphodiesterase membrane domain-containing protein [Ruminococcus sp.]
MKNFVRSIRTFIRALPHFLLFEAIFKLILLAIGAPVMTLLLKLTMKLAGVSYLDDESLLVYLHSPATIFVILILLFVSGFFTFVELSGLVACFSCAAKNEKITVGGMLLTAFRSFRKAFRGSGILRFALFTVIMTLAENTLSSGMLLAPILPILRVVFASISSSAAVAAYVLIEALLAFVIIKRIYSLHYLILTDKPFPECVRTSCEKIHHKRLRTAAAFLLWALAVTGILLLLTFGLSIIIVMIVKGFSKPDSAFRTSLKILSYAMKVFTAVSAFFAAPTMICWITSRFFADAGSEEVFKLPDRDRKKMEKSHKTVLIITVLAASAMINFSYFRALYKGNIILNSGIFTRTQITAHRGFSSVAPENTLYAFEAAVNSDTDYIELDVQLTKDNVLVVFHDDKLDRATDGRGKLTDYTYDELQQFTVVSHTGHKGQFADARIPTLEEVLQLVGKDKMFNIEIKDVGDSVRATEKTVDLIKEYGLTTSCYVTSFSYPLLKIVKRLEPKIKTALIANVAMSTSYSQLRSIDAVSLNYIFVNRNIVSTAHQNGKRVFVWTVDRREDMEQMMLLGVDNIITNKPDLAAEVVYSNSVGDTILKLLEVIFG